MRGRGAAEEDAEARRIAEIAARAEARAAAREAAARGVRVEGGVGGDGAAVQVTLGANGVVREREARADEARSGVPGAAQRGLGAGLLGALRAETALAGSSRSAPRPPPAAPQSAGSRVLESLQQEARARRLRMQTSSREKFQFEWEESEDTTRARDDELYSARPSGRAEGALEEAEPRFWRDGLSARLGRVGAGVRKADSLLGEEEVHWSEKKLSEMTERDWRILREDYEIHVLGAAAGSGSGGGGVGSLFGDGAGGGLTGVGSQAFLSSIPPPMRFWSESGLDSALLAAIARLGWSEPTPIQRQAIPLGRQRRDLIGVAETGSGKTGAYVIPMLDIILRMGPEVRRSCEHNGPLAAVLAPVGELAVQIAADTAKLAELTGVKVVPIVGGVSIREQAGRFRDGVEVVVATPGRLIECLQQGFLVFQQCRYVVLDEADMMINMGFEPQVREILEAMGGKLGGSESSGGGGGGTSAASSASSAAPSSSSSSDSAASSESSSSSSSSSSSTSTSLSVARTTIMFSATMPPSLEQLAKTYMVSPVVVRVGDEESSKNQRITQEVLRVGKGARMSRLRECLRRGLRPCIVFVNARQTADEVFRELDGGPQTVALMHGGKSKGERDAALHAFKTADAEVLVATDVAGRGIDIPNVALVINYELPADIHKYNHRIGRTGRAGKDGFAISFFDDDDEAVLFDLRQHLLATKQTVPRELETHPAVAERAKRLG
jgi:ATP-dependent RNA helicase DDX23/PRP28